MATRKVLVICSAGAKRSNIMAFVLKGMGYDALAAGIDMNTPETISDLCGWADEIVLAQRMWMERIPQEFHRKVAMFEIGPDIWAERWPDELEQKIRQLAQEYFSGV